MALSIKLGLVFVSCREDQKIHVYRLSDGVEVRRWEQSWFVAVSR